MLVTHKEMTLARKKASKKSQKFEKHLKHDGT
jgi:hypothetical protein